MLGIIALRGRPFFAIASCALLLFSCQLTFDLRRVAAVRGTITRTEIIDRNLATLDDDVLTLEIGQERYMLTHDEHYLEPCVAAVADLPKRINALREVTANPTSRANLEQLASVMTAKLDDFARTVDLERHGQHDAAMRIVLDGGGRRLMGEFRGLSANSIVSELRQRDDGLARVGAIFAQLLWTVISGVAATILLLGAYTWRSTRRFVQGMAFNAVTDSPVAARGDEAPALQPLSGSNETFRIVVDSVKDHTIFMLDTEGRVVTWNLTAERLIGYRGDEIVGQHYSIFYPQPDVIDGKPECDLRMANEQGRIESETWRVRKDGTRFLANVVITAMHSPARRLEGFVLVMRDGADHGRVKQEKDALHARLERIIAGMRDGIFEGVDVATGTTLWVSARYWEILGYDAGNMPETVAETTLLGLVHPDDLPRVLESFRNSGTGNGIVSVDHRMRTAQGEWRWMHLRSNANVDANGNRAGFWGTLQDISERKRSEERLARQEALLASTSRIAGVGGWEYDVAAATFLGSQVVLDICGWGPGEAPSPERVLHLYPPGAREIVVDAMSAAVSDAKPFDVIVPIVTASVRHRWVRVVGEPQLRDGKTVRIAGAFQDVTDLHDAAEALRESRDAAESASRTKSDFLATMSHEIRTPLNGVIGMTGLLLETALNPEQREFAEIARSSGESLLALINDILDFSKIESGSLELECIEFELRSVIDETVDAIALRASEKHLEVLVDVNRACPQSVRGDPTRLRQILLNLLSNAVKFTDVGDITLTVSPAPASEGRLALDVSVQDSGIGIPEERIDRLFTPFTQADVSTTRRHGGTGLGLSICRRLITAMGGTISIDSQPSIGTTFRFQIVLYPSSNTVAALQTPVHWPIRALLVDDHPVNLRILSAQLRSWGVTVETASDAEGALIRWDALAAAGMTPQIAILDHHMPGHDGHWLGTQIRQRDQDRLCKLVLLSSLDARFRSIDRGSFNRAIAKPVKRDTLYRLLVELTGGQPSPRPAGAIEPARFDGLRALLVDDNPVNQKIGSQLLLRMGFHVTPAWNGRQALDLLRVERFDIVLMDCQMPEMDGYDATRALRRADSGVLDCGVPVIAMTANALSSDRDRCLLAGMNDYLTKPINRTQLSATLRNVIEHASAAAQPAPALDEDADSAGAGANDPNVLDIDGLHERRR
jgi:PAS domain S-box-containing protein